ncbi:MAG: hypothetical protein F7C35_04150 [Desulfurococcales archaeon]|nr:hypothetical protein [Desulfurococcales archaeon]
MTRGHPIILVLLLALIVSLTAAPVVASSQPTLEIIVHRINSTTGSLTIRGLVSTGQGMPLPELTLKLYVEGRNISLNSSANIPGPLIVIVTKGQNITVNGTIKAVANQTVLKAYWDIYMSNDTTAKKVEGVMTVEIDVGGGVLLNATITLQEPYGSTGWLNNINTSTAEQIASNISSILCLGTPDSKSLTVNRPSNNIVIIKMLYHYTMDEAKNFTEAMRLVKSMDLQITVRGGTSSSIIVSTSLRAELNATYEEMLSYQPPCTPMISPPSIQPPIGQQVPAAIPLNMSAIKEALAGLQPLDQPWLKIGLENGYLTIEVNTSKTISGDIAGTFYTILHNGLGLPNDTVVTLEDQAGTRNITLGQLPGGAAGATTPKGNNTTQRVGGEGTTTTIKPPKSETIPAGEGGRGTLLLASAVVVLVVIGLVVYRVYRG